MSALSSSEEIKKKTGKSFYEAGICCSASFPLHLALASLFSCHFIVFVASLSKQFC